MKTYFLFFLALIACKTTVHDQQDHAKAEDRAGSVNPSFSRGVQGNELSAVSWIQVDSSQSFVCLGFFRSSDKEPFDTVRILQTSGVDINPENMPKVAFSGKNGLLVWGRKTPHPRSSYAGKLYYSLSSDGGKTWSDAMAMIEDTTAYDQRYFDIDVNPDGEFLLTWLDKRGDSNESSLYFAKLSSGKFTGISKLAENVCPCCRTDLLNTDSSRIYIAFRNIFQDTVRDMACVASFNGGKTFTGPKRISQDNWAIDGCPHTGPTIAADSNGLHFSWYTMGGGKGIFSCTAPFSLEYFGFRESESAHTLARHPQILMTPAGLIMAWDEAVEGVENLNRVMVRFRDKNGSEITWEENERSCSYPVLAQHGNLVRLAFNTIKNGKEAVQVVSYPANDLKGRKDVNAGNVLSAHAQR